MGMGPRPHQRLLNPTPHPPLTHRHEGADVAAAGRGDGYQGCKPRYVRRGRRWLRCDHHLLRHVFLNMLTNHYFIVSQEEEEEEEVVVPPLKRKRKGAK